MQLNLIEIFASIQGETSFTGLPTTFIRLATCNLRCSWCDTTYSFKKGEPFSLTSIIKQVEENGLRYVCITGGEPLLQKAAYPLMEQLIALNYSVSLETGGSLSIKEVPSLVKIILDIKCPGSLMEKHNDWNNFSLLKKTDEVKFVIKDYSDYLYMKDILETYPLLKKIPAILLSPVFGVLDPKALVEWILRDKLSVRLNLQIHKFIWDPMTKGV